MEVKRVSRGSPDYPSLLERLHKPPDYLFYKGLKLQCFLDKPRVAVVGSRNMTSYGRQVTRELVAKLAERGIVIVSGLALGVDAEAHQTALEHGCPTIAVLPTPVERPAPRANQQLAQQIARQGGCLLSMYPANMSPLKLHFLERNQLVAALSDVVVIVEAAERSGSLHTAEFAHQLGVSVMAVPGNITCTTSVGTNQLIASGAAPVTGHKDILFALGIEDIQAAVQVKGATAAEQCLLNLMQQGIRAGHELLEHSQLSGALFSQALTGLELTGKIRPLGGNNWGLSA